MAETKRPRKRDSPTGRVQVSEPPIQNIPIPKITPKSNNEVTSTMAIDWAAADFKVYPKNDYDVILVGHKFSVSSNNNEQLALFFKPTDDSDEDSGSGNIMANYVLRSDLIWRLKRDLTRLGADQEDLTGAYATIAEFKEALIPVLKSLDGVTCVVACDEPQEYEGTTRTRFKEVKQ